MSSRPPPQQSAASRRIVAGTIGKPVAATVALTVSATVQAMFTRTGDGLGLCDAEQGSTKFAKRRSLSV
jgi:hypothetical protein